MKFLLAISPRAEHASRAPESKGIGMSIDRTSDAIALLGTLLMIAAALGVVWFGSMWIH